MSDGAFIPVVTRARVAEGEGPPKLALAHRTLYFDTLNNDLYVGTKNGPAVVGGPTLVIGQGVLKRKVEGLEVDLTPASNTLRAEFEEAIEAAVGPDSAIVTRTVTLEAEIESARDGEPSLAARLVTTEQARADGDEAQAERSELIEAELTAARDG